MGVRPLVKDESGNEGKTSREHIIISDDRGFTFVAWGKYTTYRLMSEQIVDRILGTLPVERRVLYKRCETTRALNEFVTSEKILMAQSNSATEIEKSLSERFGAESFEILNKFGNKNTYWQLEAYQAIYSTMCLNLVDFYTRRAPLMLSRKDHGLELLQEISMVFKNELKWSQDELEAQQSYLKNYIEKELSWRKSFS